MDEIFQTQKALKISQPGELEITESSLVPRPEADEVLVRVIYVALNPVDSKSTDLSPTLGATIGCDFAGEVLQVGMNVKKLLSVGDRVCGSVLGNNPDGLDNGAFSEYVTVAGDLLIKIPSSMSYQTAATLGIGLATVGLALHRLKVPFPGAEISENIERKSILIYGGGTATGGLAIQIARMCGMVPITTCSPRNFDRVKALGAVAVFDYHQPDCGSEIHTFTKDHLGYAIDCITDTSGGQYVGLDPFPIRSHTRRSIKPNWIIAFTLLNKPLNWKRPFLREAKPQDREFGERWFKIIQELLDQEAIEAHPYEERAGGLEGVIDGLAKCSFRAELKVIGFDNVCIVNLKISTLSSASSLPSAAAFNPRTSISTRDYQNLSYCFYLYFLVTTVTSKDNPQMPALIWSINGLRTFAIAMMAIALDFLIG
ncbi:hypothetical protein VTL71DRAFT_12403 [Oculimacula yallundae]|uniref:Enoyl reductase (ER) domain-containing protein n=1 Tax=Oculimacula yallundae TaxID=86028 RepID=A0ABR4CPA0_9HELO